MVRIGTRTDLKTDSFEVFASYRFVTTECWSTSQYCVCFLTGVSMCLFYLQSPWASEEGARGPRDFDISHQIYRKNGCFFVSEWAKWNFTTFVPPAEFFLATLEDSLLALRRKKPFRRPCPSLVTTTSNYFSTSYCSVRRLLAGCTTLGLLGKA